MYFGHPSRMLTRRHPASNMFWTSVTDFTAELSQWSCIFYISHGCFRWGAWAAVYFGQPSRMLLRTPPGSNMFQTSGTDIAADGSGQRYCLEIHHGNFRGLSWAVMYFWHPSRMLPRKHPGSNKFWTSVEDITAEGSGQGYNLHIRHGCFRGGAQAEICSGYPWRKFPRTTPEWMSKNIPHGFRSGDIRNTDTFEISLWSSYRHIRHGCIHGYQNCIRYP